MSAQPEWNDEDFHVPPDRSLAELVNSLSERLTGGGQLGGALIEDLRLYIVVRKLQRLDQSQIDDELIAWGLPSDYVVELTSSTLTAGNYGEVEESRQGFVDGRSTGFHRNPTYSQRVRGSERAEARIRQAARMIAPPADPALQFDPVYVPTSVDAIQEPAWQRLFHQFMYATFSIGGLVMILVVLYCAGLRW